MTLTDYKNGNANAKIKKMYILLAPRNKHDGTGGLESLGIYTSIEYAGANAYGKGIAGGNIGAAIAHVNVNYLPDPLLGRENKQLYPAIFTHSEKVFGTYTDEANRPRFGKFPTNPVLPWSVTKITRFNDLNNAFGDKYGDAVRQSEMRERENYVNIFNARRTEECGTAYAILILTPSAHFPPNIADIAAIFYGERDSKKIAIETATKFRYDHPTAPRLVVAPLPVNSIPDVFIHEMFTARSQPDLMLYSDNDKGGDLDIREYENMLAEVGRVHVELSGNA